MPAEWMSRWEGGYGCGWVGSGCSNHIDVLTLSSASSLEVISEGLVTAEDGYRWNIRCWFSEDIALFRLFGSDLSDLAQHGLVSMGSMVFAGILGVLRDSKVLLYFHGFAAFFVHVL